MPPGRAASAWRHPWGLAAWTFLVIAWWWVPIVLLLSISFGSRSAFGEAPGVSLDAYRVVFEAEELRAALEQSLRLAVLTIAIALPLGTALAVGLYHWRGPGLGWASGTVILALATPQTVMVAALFLFIVAAIPWLRFGTPAQLTGHVTLTIPFVTVIVWIGLANIGATQSETAMDLGAPPASALLRVVAPQMIPALLGAVAVAFVLSFDNIVVSQWLCIENVCKTIPVQLFGARGVVRVDPVVTALGGVGMATTSLVLVGMALAIRKATRRLR